MFETVLVVDDEVHVRKTLIKMIESNDTGWEAIGEAGNGQEALELAEKLQPDLIITDIRMPKMDGLQLAEAMRESCRDTKVVILTGYKDFAYAQTALKFGVIDFLLKPCPEEEVCAVLAKVRAAVREHKQQKRLEQQQAEETAVRAVINRLPANPAIVRQVEARYGEGETGLLSVDNFFPPGKAYRKEELGLLQFAVHNIMQELIDLHFESGSVFVVRFNAYLFVLGPPRSAAGQASDRQHNFFVQLEQTIDKLLGIEVQVRPLGKLRQLFAEPERMALGQSELNSSQQIVGADAEALPEHAAYSVRIEQMENEFLAYILIGNMKQVKQVIAELSGDLVKCSLNEARMEALVLAVALERVVRNQLSAVAEKLNIGVELAALHRLRRNEDVVDWLHDWTDKLMAEISRWSDHINQNVIQRAIRYIEQHYMERCSLQDVASHVFLNHKYFGHLFKRETGEGFVSYVTRIRLEKASLLLNHTDMTVIQIAKSCGYEDPNYFTTVFRKKNGATPNEYRKKNKD